MNEKLIYTDMCSEELEHQITKEIGVRIIRRMTTDTWSVNDTMGVITTPSLILAVINRLDTISLMEISLLNFMCKPILVTTETINHYPVVYNSVDFVDSQCSLVREYSSFLSWYSLWIKGRLT